MEDVPNLQKKKKAVTLELNAVWMLRKSDLSDMQWTHLW